MIAFSLEQDILIDFQLSHVLRKKRTQDRTIMDLALGFSKKASILKSINRVRMSLRVSWISDLTMADGRSIDIDKKWLFPTGQNINRNDYHWPKEHHVTDQDWGIWR
jgi:hypothetical protein